MRCVSGPRVCIRFVGMTYLVDSQHVPKGALKHTLNTENVTLLPNSYDVSGEQRPPVILVIVALTLTYTLVSHAGLPFIMRVRLTNLSTSLSLPPHGYNHSSSMYAMVQIQPGIAQPLRVCDPVPSR